MRLFAVTAALCALSQTAVALPADCNLIKESAARLACYDKASPVAKSAAAKPVATAPGSKADGTQYVDTISAEDALMNARLKNICKGC
jgi:hypothetical protein